MKKKRTESQQKYIDEVAECVNFINRMTEDTSLKLNKGCTVTSVRLYTSNIINEIKYHIKRFDFHNVDFLDDKTERVHTNLTNLKMIVNLIKCGEHGRAVPLPKGYSIYSKFKIVY